MGDVTMSCCGSGKYFAAASLVVFVTIYVAAQIFATGQAFSMFLGWNYYLGIAVGFAVVLSYSTSGGFVAVVWSDIFQGTMMLLGLVLLPVVGLVSVGGFAPEVPRGRRSATGRPVTHRSSALAVGFPLGWLRSAPGRSR